MKRLALAALALCGACASPSDIPLGTPEYLRDRIAAAAAAPDTSAPAAATPLVSAPAPRRGTPSPTDGIVDLAAPAVAAFVGRLAGGDAETALATTALDTDLVLAAVWVRNPGVAAARADVEAARRVHEQASWLDDVETRLRSVALPAANVRAEMPSAPMPYPGLAALRGEMLDLEVVMAAAKLRMTYLATSADALGAYHAATHHAGEAAIRREQVDVLGRLVAASRSRVESGRAPQAELSESLAELAMSQSDLAHAETALVAARRTLNSLLDRAADAPLVTADHADPPAATPGAADLADLARRWSPEIAMARAEAARAAVAERMALRMALPAPAPGSVAMAGGAMPGGAATPGAPDLGFPAWAAELAARRAAAERRADEAARGVERMVAEMAFELESMARMFRVAKTATEPATRQALDERLRLYEGGRGDFAELLAAAKRHLDARHDLVAARHDYRTMEAKLWMAVGARPELANGANR